MPQTSANDSVPQTPSSSAQPAQACRCTYNMHVCTYAKGISSVILHYLQTQSVPRSALRQLGWEQYLQQYAQRCAPQLATDTVAQLTAAVHEEPQKPESWWSLLSKLDAAAQSLTDKRQALALLQMYEWATKQVPRHGNYENNAFLNLWIGYAKQQW